MEIKSKRIQCDEIWSFVYAKEKNKPTGMEDAGDVWTWTAIDADTKLIVSWYVGNRDAESGSEFMNDVAKRLSNRVQLTTDGLHTYLDAVSDAFATHVDFAQLQKIYGKEGNTGSAEKKHSPPNV
jgi:IS1 family transposase